MQHGLHIRRDGDWVTSPLGVNSHAKEEMSTTIGMGAYAHGLDGSLAVLGGGEWVDLPYCSFKRPDAQLSNRTLVVVVCGMIFYKGH